MKSYDFMCNGLGVTDQTMDYIRQATPDDDTQIANRTVVANWTSFNNYLASRGFTAQLPKPVLYLNTGHGDLLVRRFKVNLTSN